MLSLTKNLAPKLLLPVRSKANRNIPLSTTTALFALDKNDPPHIKAIVDQISQLKFYEVAVLNEALKRELKIPDVQRVVSTGGAAISADEDNASAAATKTSFTVKLTKFDDTKKVALIKEIKKLVEGINLVEAKRFVEECPKVIRSNLTKDEAEALQKQLEAAGGIVKVE